MKKITKYILLIAAVLFIGCSDSNDDTYPPKKPDTEEPELEPENRVKMIYRNITPSWALYVALKAICAKERIIKAKTGRLLITMSPCLRRYPKARKMAGGIIW